MKTGKTLDSREVTPQNPSVFWQVRYMTSKAAETQPEEKPDKWKVRGQRYDSAFRPPRKESEPSEWYIVLFPLHQQSVRLSKWAFGKLPSLKLWRQLLDRYGRGSSDQARAVEEGKPSATIDDPVLS